MVARGDDLHASGLVLVTPLAVEVQEDPVSGRVRTTVKDVKADRYGGRNPTTFLVKGRPEDYGERVEHDPSSKVQFFTDENGVVHPIRSSYEHKAATPGRTYEAWENEAF